MVPHWYFESLDLWDRWHFLQEMIQVFYWNLPQTKNAIDQTLSWMYQDFISSVQSLSGVQLFATPGTAAHQASLSITDSRSLLKLKSIESVMPSNHLVLCRPLLPPSVFPSIRVFSNESVLCIRWPKYYSFSISTSGEYSGLISFRNHWFNLLEVQGTLKSLLNFGQINLSEPQFFHL